MSSNIKISKICEHCGKEFIAKTTVTRFCSAQCSKTSYKKRKREGQIGHAIEKVNKTKLLNQHELNLEAIKQKDFLSIKEAYTILGVSERTFYRLLKDKTIKSTKVGSRTIIKRTSINALFK